MRVTLIHCSFIYTGGGERIVLEQVAHLRARGYEVECYAPIYDSSQCFPDIISRYDIKTFLPQLPAWFPMRHAMLLLLSCVLIPFYVFKFRTTDVFIGENQPGMWLAFVLSRLLRKPYIAFLNHPNRILYPREHEDWAAVRDFKFLNSLFRFVRPLLVYLDRVSVFGARERLVNGIFIGQEIERVYGCTWIACPSGTSFLADCTASMMERTAATIRPWPVPDIFGNQYALSYLDYTTLEHNSSEDVAHIFVGSDRGIRESFILRNMLVKGFDLSHPYILYTGRHQPWKRIDWLIEIFALACERMGDKPLFLLIPGSHTPHTLVLQEKAREYRIENRVVFLGEIHQTELSLLYRHAQVYAFPSEKEDFGIVVIEAMGQGVPVVAWDVGGPTDSVVDGVTGYLVKPYDRHAFADRLFELVNNSSLRERLGSAGVEHVRRSFGWERHISLLESAFAKYD